MNAPYKKLSIRRTDKISFFTLNALILSRVWNSTNNPPKPTPTSAAFSPVNLGIPADALNSPITGTLDPNTPMKVNVFFKLNQSQQNQLQQSRDKSTGSQAGGKQNRDNRCSVRADQKLPEASRTSHST